MATKTTPKVIAFEVQTSTLNSIVCKDSLGVDIPGLSLKLYDDSGNEITNPLLTIGCVKTIVDYEPTFDYITKGGGIFIDTNINFDCYLYKISAPDIAAPIGSYEAIQNINLRYISAGTFFDFQSRFFRDEFMSRYNAINHAGKSRIVLKHSAGGAAKVMVVVIMEIESTF